MSHRTTPIGLLAMVAAAATAQSIPLPYNDDFESGSLNSSLWTRIFGAAASDQGINPPTPVFGMNLDGFDTAQTRPINADVLGTVGEVVTVAFWAQHRGVEAGETLIIQYTDDTGTIQSLVNVESNGIDEDRFRFFQFALPIDGYHDQLAVRFTSGGNQSDDDWYVDNVRVGPFAGTNPPFTDDFEDGFASLTDWAVISNAQTSAGTEPNPPSGNAVARLDSDDSIETVPFLLSVEPNVSDQQYVRYWVRADGLETGDTLRIEYNAPVQGAPGQFAFKLIEEITATGADDACFAVSQFAVPFDDYSDEFRVRFTANVAAPQGAWLLDDVTVSPVELPADPNCALADLTAPCNLIDLSDADVFIQAFLAQDAIADIVAPFGIVDLGDVDAFINAFLAGCNQPYGEPGF